jgi:hypothetical protein
MLKIMVRFFIDFYQNQFFILVTHVIACGEIDKIAFRTINYLRGIVLGKWILSEKCIKKKRFYLKIFVLFRD